MNKCVKCLEIRLERADELVKIAYEHATMFEEFVENGVEITPYKIEKKFQDYLDDYGLDYE